MISTRSFCHTPTHEYVVPKSIPIAFFIVVAWLVAWLVAGCWLLVAGCLLVDDALQHQLFFK
jgi:hypothetical protein